MKTSSTSRRRAAGSALLMTLIMSAVALILVAGILSWAAGNARLAARATQYTRAVAAAEAAVEKVNSQMASDYLNSGEAQVIANLNSYRQTVPTSSDSSYWTNWQFSDAQSNLNRTLVLQGSTTNYTVLNSAYAGLNGFASTYTLISDAEEIDTPQNVVAGVMEQMLLTRIPIFQFAMYSSDEMEISCGEPFVVSGPVHANGNLYVEPDNLLTFKSSVTAVGSVLFQRDPLDTRPSPAGAVTYQVPPKGSQPALTLPIGATNTPQAIRAIIEPPAPSENPTSPIGRLRYFNQVDLMVTVSNTAVIASSGYFNNWATVIPSNQLALFIATNSSFYDWRENKTIYPVSLNVANLAAWGLTNTNLHPALNRNLNSVYIWDKRTFTGANLGAVRVFNGQQLPTLGLTVATHDPLYVQGHFNQPVAAYLGTNNTSTTLPASLVADAVTVLSVNWSDANSTSLLSSRGAGSTTVNAALLTGVVETTLGEYSGGMENFPRFLENWGSANVFTYNGSMVKMFPSLYATNVWNQTNVYKPPARNWAYDANFNTPAKLPPLTPSLQVVVRGQWATLAANSTNAP